MLFAILRAHMPTLAVNKKVRFEYDILETLEAGIVLHGSEVKSIRNGGAKLEGSFVTIHGNTPTILNLHIAPYRYAPDPSYIPDTTRTLLLHHKEISYLRGKIQEDGLTIIPISLYTKARMIKLEIGIARGKKLHDKRETIKNRDLDRDLKRYI